MVFAHSVNRRHNIVHRIPNVRNVPFFFQQCVESIQKLNISNIKKLFQVIVMLSEQKNFEIDDLINRFLLAVNEKERFLGILALLIKIQWDMQKRRSEAQERSIRDNIARIEEAFGDSSNLRGAFYEQMASVIKNHKKTDEIRFISEWADKLLSKFKEEFFEENREESENVQFGEIRYIWKPDQLRMAEVAPMFNLIKELRAICQKWNEDVEEESVRSAVSTCSLKDLTFVFEADIPLLEEYDDRIQISRQLFFTIQWCRTILNAFLSQNKIDFLSTEAISRNSIRIFYVMLKCEKKLIESIKKLGEWNVPTLCFKSELLTIVSAKQLKKRKARKRKSDESSYFDNEAIEEEEDALGSEDLATQLAQHVTQFMLRPVVHLISLTISKRSCLIYLCGELQNILQDLIRNKNKTTSHFGRTVSKPKAEKFYHGDFATVWGCLKKATEEVWKIVENSNEFFTTLADSSEEIQPKMQADMEELGQRSLQLINLILKGELYGSEEKLTSAEKNEKRSILLRIIEKCLLKTNQISLETETAKIEIGKYILANAEFAPTPIIAVLILELFNTLKIEDADMRKSMAKFALAYLKKDWRNVEKGAKFNTCVRDILKSYVSLRKEKEQIMAIQWILTNKVVKLVPDDKKRKSVMFSQQSDDDLVERNEDEAIFHCINKQTFANVFKTLFAMLNACTCKYYMQESAIKNGQITEEETMTHWENASSCFLILCLLLRVNEIRSNAVLASGIKEGRQFLVNVSRKSSFIHIVDNISKNSNFNVICKKIEKTISTVQQGNRVLQSIGTYAKEHKSVNLLKKFPELRAENENCLRVIRSAMVKNKCLEAFTGKMSLDGLLSEVSRFNAHHLEVAQGEQVFYGGKHVYSDFHATPSTSDHKKGGKKNELDHAIQNAKKIANKALKGESSASNGDIESLRKDHAALASKVDQLTALISQLQKELADLKTGAPAAKAAPAKEEAKKEDDKDDDFDLFGSDEEEDDEEKKKLTEERLKAYAEKKSKKPGPIAKSSVILDVKPWDDETDLAEMEKLVRGIEMDGLVWGGGKLIAIGYGIKKLQIICVIEDAKVSVDDLIDKITEDFESHVQSVDIVAFNKI
ncbi:unnamed protein product [Caenorhabditis bovis]|uniref:Translation elongation factor EF1B beta/delta subunit guanine nucleotide exchange domain-containing protein n=1 Tax=Caenorhabditis bovis TaxID=2654633 RepID=A0A8S1FDZ7_9PELO|nr:unnamed protein product [Caenorhabditis bovis]